MRKLCLLGLLLWGTVHAAPPPDFYLEHDWYAIELVLFEYNSSDSRRSRAEEDLRGRLPDELRSELIVLDLPNQSMVPSIKGYDSQLFNVDLNSLPWFYKQEVAPLIDRVRARFNSTGLVQSSDDEDPASTLIDELYPSWLEPDWYAPSNEWIEIFRTLQLPESISQSLVFHFFSEPLQIENVVEEPELTQGQRIELEFHRYEADLLQSQSEWHSNGYTLAAEAARIERSGWRLIHHGRFHATLNVGAEGKSFFIQAGQPESEGLYTFEMVLNISKRLYIHADIQLWRTVPQLTEAISNSDKYGLRLRPSVRTLFEKRRIVDDQPNFFDHPEFGLIVKIEELPIEPRLLELLQSFDDPSQPIQ
ncbi:hypothetical protein C6500_00365 [Candidatus Poribacteria bacterium]|nr:MAG: hypothetical protein C6500_00365 [Candidatus Poribacteria bacterium]